MSLSLIDIYGTCAWCGCGAAVHGPVCDADCSEAYEVLRVSRWPVSLGTAIARFALRAEVAELVEALAFEADEIGACCRDGLMGSAGRAFLRHEDALTRLAALALNGAGR